MARKFQRALMVALLLAGSLTSPFGSVEAKGKSDGTTVDDDYESAPSYRYGELGPAACHEELDARHIAYTVVAKAPGVLIPVRIPEGVGGVRFQTALARREGAKSPWEVFDCRLVLALSDLAKILVRHGVDEAAIFSAWRPNARHPKDKPGVRHTGALAVDIARLGKKDEKGKRVWLSVQKDWHGRIGAKTCGPKAAAPTTKSAVAKELRAMVCEAAEQRLFTSMLTPNYNRAHFNHFHFDITVGVKWRLVR